MSNLTFKVPAYHPVGCDCLICGAAEDALREIESLRTELESRDHTIMCLKAEVRARSAAAEVLRGENDILEEGWREAKDQIKALQKRINELQPMMAETDPADLGKT